MLSVVAPLLQVIPFAMLDVSFILSPVQIAPVPLAVITGAVVIVDLTVTLSCDWQPFASVTFNKYTPGLLTDLVTDVSPPGVHK